MLQRLRRLLSRDRREQVEVCETCGVACDGACRARAAREHARTRAARSAGLR